MRKKAAWNETRMEYRNGKTEKGGGIKEKKKRKKKCGKEQGEQAKNRGGEQEGGVGG